MNYAHTGNMTSDHTRFKPGCVMRWKSPMTMLDIHYNARPHAQNKLGSPWVGPQQVVRQATGHTVGIQKGADTPIIFIHVDDLKVCPAPPNVSWTPGYHCVRVQ